MSEGSLSGRCLCGAVRFQAKPEHPEKPEMDACHCSMCRRWAGAPWLTVSCDPALRIEGEENLGVYKSSDWAERVFCKTCGTTLFWRTQDNSLATVSAQAFDDPAQFTFATEIYIDDKPANYAFANQTRKMTGEEVVKQFFQNQA